MGDIVNPSRELPLELNSEPYLRISERSVLIETNWGRQSLVALFLHNSRMVNLSAGELGLEIDYGRSKPCQFPSGGRRAPTQP